MKHKLIGFQEKYDSGRRVWRFVFEDGYFMQFLPEEADPGPVYQRVYNLILTFRTYGKTNDILVSAEKISERSCELDNSKFTSEVVGKTFVPRGNPPDEKERYA